MLFGAEVLSVSIAPVLDFAADLPQQDDHFEMTVAALNFCNVTITYTHPGQEDVINAEIWLPLKGWNGRFLGTGGGGWVAGRGAMGAASLAYAVSKGFSAVSTDAGHGSDAIDVADPSVWALKSPGNVNWPMLQNFAHVAYNDAALLGKAVTESFYSSKPKYSYWTGCSTGGRQGLMMAQRYPEVYDGVLTAAPANNWARFVPSEYWAQLAMNEAKCYPPPCEFEAITAAAIEACDELDGVKDGIISAPGLCTFTGTEVVGKVFTCIHDGIPSQRKISAGAVKIAQAAWTGPSTLAGKPSWYGINHNAQLTGLVMTVCEPGPANCKPGPFPIATSWIKYFVAKDPDFDVSAMTRAQYDEVMRQSDNQFRSIMSTDDADLSGLKLAGGKVIMWHGGADRLIPINGSVDYYRRVLEQDENAGEYFKFFEAPGVDHCGLGNGFFPAGVLDRLVEWVEKGKKPETLMGRSLPDKRGRSMQRPLCAYPQVAVYKGGNVSVASSYVCGDSFVVSDGYKEL